MECGWRLPSGGFGAAWGFFCGLPLRFVSSEATSTYCGGGSFASFMHSLRREIWGFFLLLTRITWGNKNTLARGWALACFRKSAE